MAKTILQNSIVCPIKLEATRIIQVLSESETSELLDWRHMRENVIRSAQHLPFSNNKGTEMGRKIAKNSHSNVIH